MLPSPGSHGSKPTREASRRASLCPQRKNLPILPALPSEPKSCRITPSRCSRRSCAAYFDAMVMGLSSGWVVRHRARFQSHETGCCRSSSNISLALSYRDNLNYFSQAPRPSLRSSGKTGDLWLKLSLIKKSRRRLKFDRGWFSIENALQMMKWNGKLSLFHSQ